MSGTEALNADFKSVSRLLFGSEIGELADFEPYLQETMLPWKIAKSSVSGKEIFLATPKYGDGAKFVSQDEIGALKFKPLNVNEIKDIDSLFGAVSERMGYCGNKVFGKNQAVEMVDNCTDCSGLYFSHNAYQVKYAAYCSYVRDAEHIYGVSAFPKASHSMRCLEGLNASRCFETYYASNVSDMYYSMGCSGCTNCMFSFNLKARNYAIGNLQLEKGRYLELREKLVSEIAEKLRKGGRIFSIADLAGWGAEKGDEGEVDVPPSKIPAIIENGFESATKLLLGRPHKGIGRFGPWLLKNTLVVKKVRGAFGTPTYKVGLPIVERLPAARLATLDEARASSSKCIALGEGETPPLEEVAERAAGIAYFTFEFVDGHSENAVDTPSIFNATNVYRIWDGTNTMLAAYSSGVIESKYVFGEAMRSLYSQFCIKCHDVTEVKLGFEVDSSYKSSACYFCHNCENVQDGILCFNAKGLRHAIGNQEVPRGEYARVKKMLLDYLNSELERKGRLDFDIFTIGAGKK